MNAAAPLFLLISGNILEAARFAKYAGLPNSFWTYIGTVEALQEIEGTNLKAIKIGTWYKLKDIENINALLLIKKIPVQEVTVGTQKKQKPRYIAILQSVLVKIELAKFPKIFLKRRKEHG